MQKRAAAAWQRLLEASDIAAGNTVAELPILAGEDVGHVTFVQMLGRCLARGFCMGPQS